MLATAVAGSDFEPYLLAKSDTGCGIFSVAGGSKALSSGVDEGLRLAQAGGIHLL